MIMHWECPMPADSPATASPGNSGETPQTSTPPDAARSGIR
jgi:hypothetical protein